MKMEKSGGRPKKETKGFSKEKTNGFENKETKIKPNVNENENENVNVNVNDNDNENVSDSCVDGLQEVIGFYNDNIGLLTPYGREVFIDYLQEMDYDVIIYAMQKAVEANIRTIQYIKGTLNNWSNAGVKTLLQAQEESKNFKNKDKKELAKETLQEQTERYRKEWGLTDED